MNKYNTNIKKEYNIKINYYKVKKNWNIKKEFNFKVTKHQKRI